MDHNFENGRADQAPAESRSEPLGGDTTRGLPENGVWGRALQKLNSLPCLIANIASSFADRTCDIYTQNDVLVNISSP